MSLMFRRGTTGQQQSPSFVPDNGEPIWEYETKKLYIGDANTAGGIEVAMTSTLPNLAGANLDYNGLTKAIDLNLSGVTTNAIAEGTNNKYFSATLAQAAVGAALIAGNPSNTGITFAYDDVDDKITAVVTGGGGSGSGTVSTGTATHLAFYSATGTTVSGTGTGLVFNSGTGTLTATNLAATEVVATSVSASTITRTAVTSDSLLNPVIDVGTEAAPISLKFISNDATKDYAVFFGSCTDLVGSGLTFRATRGTQLVKTTVQAGDILASIKVTGFDGTDYRSAGEFGIIADPTNPPDNGFVPGMFAVSLINEVGGSQLLTFSSNGVLNAPVIQATGYITSALPTGAEEGFIVFDSLTKEFKGWNGTAWVVLG